MKALTKFAPALLMIFLVLTGCDSLNNEEPEVGALTEEDLEAASSIMAESLSDEKEGMMSDLYDMTANVEGQRLSYSGRRFWRDPILRPCRGTNFEYDKTYDATTGIHAVTYQRMHENENCQKTVDVSLNYIFTDSDGNFIATPRVNASDISEIAYEGSRSGSGTYTSRRGGEQFRSFNQTGSWNLSGLQSNIATLTGEQTNAGEYSYQRPDSTGELQTRTGTYTITLETVDVTLAQSAGEEDLENELTGSIQYTISMTRTVNGETETKEAEGVIELEGNGRALLRFNGLRQLYRVSLRDGEVEHTDETTG